MWLVGTIELPGNLPVRLLPGEYIVGRAKRAQIVIRDTTVSRRHARLILARSVLKIIDLDSRNGTKVNECPISECELRVGDQVRFGCVACVVSSSPLLARRGEEDDSTYQVRSGEDTSLHIEGLTPAQTEVVEQLLKGRTEAEIAAMLDKSPHTVHTHLKAIYQRLGVHSRAELIVKYVHRE